ncbi:endo-inulinase [Portibacter lacus]|uniref:Endo-inulinase n=2 Tax=Portibacter lacus TaxID=1099794 RepID=A0AA37STZ9_9BACT|nr:endo-inulinase [Portibacter lacus]
MILEMFSCSSSIPDEIEYAMEALPNKIDYNIHVKPILSDRCYKCHGPDANKRKAGFRLDIEENALAKVLSEQSIAQHSISKGKPAQSEVFLRIISNDENYMMPPPESNLTMTEEEIAILAKWIEDGAKFKEHWSFMPPEKPSIPNIENNEWVRQDIDRFILAKLQENKLEPTQAAKKSTLLRRLSLDITGLPPSVEEIESFLKNDQENAYEQKIDELLARPQYGERMASIWLDAARYADTHGYQDDGLRTSWPWRKWVIDAYNNNMPYDQFITEQLAGDLLPNAKTSQILATSFNRNHPQTQEGGVVEEEYRVEYVADKTNTYGKAILGLTMECARCHDHKYDPISQKDYYALSAFFNNNNDSGIVPYNGEATPTIMLPTPQEEKLLDSLHREIGLLEEEIISDKYIADLEQWLASVENIDLNLEEGKVADFSFEDAIEVDKNSLNLDNNKSAGWGGIGGGKTTSYLDKVTGIPDAAIFGDIDSKPLIDKGKDGNGLKFLGDCGIRFNRRMDYDRNQPFSVSIWIKLLKEGEKGPIFNNTNGDFEGYRGWICKLNEDGTLSFQLNHVWPDNAIDYQTTDPIALNEWTNIVMTYDGSSRAEGLRFYVNGKEPKSFLHQDNLRKSLLHGVKGSNWSNYPLIIGKEKERSIQNVMMDEFKVYDRELSVIEVEKLARLETTEKPNNQELLEYYLLSGKNEQYNALLDSLTQLRAKENLVATDVIEVMVMNEKRKIRPTYILDRGMYDSPLAEVKPGTPEKFGDLPLSEVQSRLDLAKWTISEKNPFTARVHVNRIWNTIFGRGLVLTQEDFGNQGSLPTHPELLDYLAVDFMKNGWDTKRLMRKIFLSATYRQGSVASENALAADPLNHYYSRYPSHRLSAEIIRDHALASSGLLSDSIGGPSVYPYQPDGIWKALATRNATVYHQGKGEDLYRRSLYTIWKRTAPPPSMLNFDAPDRYICTVDRQKTSTPLQSLVLMNDPQYLEASKVLAESTLAEIIGPLNEKINHMFMSLISRPADPLELEVMEDLYQDELIVFSRDVSKAEALLDIGDYKIEKGDSVPELAALTVVASTLMNYDEFITKR